MARELLSREGSSTIDPGVEAVREQEVPGAAAELGALEEVVEVLEHTTMSASEQHHPLSNALELPGAELG